jgi:hypothetical protein
LSNYDLGKHVRLQIYKNSDVLTLVPLNIVVKYLWTTAGSSL